MFKQLSLMAVVIATSFIRGKNVLVQPMPAAPTEARRQSQDDRDFNQQQALQDLRKSISGKETQPSAEVFKNIQLFKKMPAGRLLMMMEMGYAKSLGVNCTHCHVANSWEKEDKPTKQIAREMAGMVNTINADLLKKIKNLQSENPIVNCTTCHRGQVKPAINMP